MLTCAGTVPYEVPKVYRPGGMSDSREAGSRQTRWWVSSSRPKPVPTDVFSKDGFGDPASCIWRAKFVGVSLVDA